MNQSPFAPQTFVVDGLSAVAEYLRWKSSSIEAIFCTPKEQKKVESLLEACKCRAPLLIRSPHESKNRAEKKNKFGGKSGQNQSLDTETRSPVSARVKLQALPFPVWLQSVPKKKENLVLALDHVQDPRNMGAIVRTAGFFGITSVLVPERRQVLLTQASVATSEGGFAVSDLICATNLSRALEDLKEQGYWILGASMEGASPEQYTGKYEKVVLVMGSEGDGLSKGIKDKCDVTVGIRGAGKLDSLNVSVAAGILMNAFANSQVRP